MTVTVRLLAVAAAILVIVALAGCYGTNSAAEDAKQGCEEHGGVASVAWSHWGQGELLYSCKDGTVGAHEG